MGGQAVARRHGALTTGSSRRSPERVLTIEEQRCRPPPPRCPRHRHVARALVPGRPADTTVTTARTHRRRSGPPSSKPGRARPAHRAERDAATALVDAALTGDDIAQAANDLADTPPCRALSTMSTCCGRRADSGLSAIDRATADQTYLAWQAECREIEDEWQTREERRRPHRRIDRLRRTTSPQLMSGSLLTVYPPRSSRGRNRPPAPEGASSRRRPGSAASPGAGGHRTSHVHIV